jgi:hypothetical protein
VALEAVSSSLTIYPFMWYVEKLPSLNISTLNQIHNYLRLFQYFWSKHIYKPSWGMINNKLVHQLCFTKFENQRNYSTQYRYNTFKSSKLLSTILLEVPKSTNLFKIYTTLLTQTTVSTSQIHPSHRFNFLLNKQLNISSFNLTKLKHKWLDSYHLFYNLFFYKLPLLSFSTPVFQNELLSLNWHVSDKLKTYWKYVSPSFYLARNKVMKSEFLLFNYLGKQGFYMALVFDVLYHKNTIFLLHRNQFFTFALVPLQHSLYTVNFAIPISNESPFINLFFIRLLLHIQKTTKQSYLKQVSQVWSGTKFL